MPHAGPQGARVLAGPRSSLESLLAFFLPREDVNPALRGIWTCFEPVHKLYTQLGALLGAPAGFLRSFFANTTVRVTGTS